MPNDKWWTRAPGAAWKSAKTKVMAAWQRLVGTEARLSRVVAEAAVAFGREARTVYADVGSWSDVLETRLAADWQEAGRETENAWETVKDAVRHGWESAGEVGAPAVAAAARPPRSATKASARPAKASAKATASTLRRVQGLQGSRQGLVGPGRRRGGGQRRHGDGEEPRHASAGAQDHHPVHRKSGAPTPGVRNPWRAHQGGAGAAEHPVPARGRFREHGREAAETRRRHHFPRHVAPPHQALTSSPGSGYVDRPRERR
jgi:hypothetical protein